MSSERRAIEMVDPTETQSVTSRACCASWVVLWFSTPPTQPLAQGPGGAAHGSERMACRAGTPQAPPGGARPDRP